MPKESAKITKFSQGTYTIIHSEDLERMGEVSVYAKNIDSITEKGVLKGVDSHTTYDISKGATGYLLATLDTPTKIAGISDNRDLIFYDKSDGFLKYISQIYSDSNPVSLIAQLTTAGHENITFSIKANSIYIGLGNSAPSYFVKYFDTTQFGVPLEGYKLCLGELSPSSFLSNMEKSESIKPDSFVGFSSTMPDRLFYWTEANNDIKGAVTNSIGSTVVSMTASKVEPNIVWALREIPGNGYSRNIITKVQINYANTEQSTIVYDRDCLLGFTRGNGSKDSRTEANQDYSNNSLLKAANNNDLGTTVNGYVMQGGRDIKATFIPGSTSEEYIWVCTVCEQTTERTHVPVDVLNKSFIRQDNSKLLSRDDTLQHFLNTSSDATHPCFNPHIFLYGVTTGNAEDSYKLDVFQYNIFHRPNHSARNLWNISNTDLNATLSHTSEMVNAISPANNAARFYDRSSYWHYPKTGYQLAGCMSPDFKWLKACTGSPAGPTTTIAFDSHGQHQYVDHPAQMGPSTWVFYDMMWLYKWTKFATAADNWTNDNGGGKGSNQISSVGTSLHSGTSVKTNYGYTSFTGRPWGFIDNGGGAHQTQWSTLLSGSESRFGEAAGSYFPASNTNFNHWYNDWWELGPFSKYDIGGHVMARSMPGLMEWPEFYDAHLPNISGAGYLNNDGNSTARGPHDGTRVRFDAHNFIGEYEEYTGSSDPNNLYGVKRDSFGLNASGSNTEDEYSANSAAYNFISLGQGCGWTGLMNWNYWFTNDIIGEYNYTTDDTKRPYWNSNEHYYDNDRLVSHGDQPSDADHPESWNVHDSFAYSGSTDLGVQYSNRAKMMNNLGPREFPKMIDATAGLEHDKRSGHSSPNSKGWMTSQMKAPGIAYPRFPLVDLPSHSGYVGLTMSFEGSFSSIWNDGVKLLKGDNWEENTQFDASNPHGRAYAGETNVGDMLSKSNYHFHQSNRLWPLSNENYNDDSGYLDVGPNTFGIPSNNRWWGKYTSGGLTGQVFKVAFGLDSIFGYESSARITYPGSGGAGVVTPSFPSGASWTPKAGHAINRKHMTEPVVLKAEQFTGWSSGTNGPLADDFIGQRWQHLGEFAMSNVHDHNVSVDNAHPNRHNWYFPQKGITNTATGLDDQNADSPDKSPTGVCLFINRYDCNGAEHNDDSPSYDFNLYGEVGGGVQKGSAFPHIRRSTSSSYPNWSGDLADAGYIEQKDLWIENRFKGTQFDNSPLWELYNHLITQRELHTNGPKNICYNNVKKRMFLLTNSPMSTTASGGKWGNTTSQFTGAFDGEGGNTFWTRATTTASLKGMWKNTAELATAGISEDSTKYYITSPISVMSASRRSGWNKTADSSQFDGNYAPSWNTADVKTLDNDDEHATWATKIAAWEDYWGNHLCANIASGDQTWLKTGFKEGLVGREIINSTGDKYIMSGLVTEQCNVLDPKATAILPEKISSITTYPKHVESNFSNVTQGDVLAISYNNPSGGIYVNQFWLGDFQGDLVNANHLGGYQGGTMTGGEHIPWGIAPMIGGDKSTLDLTITKSDGSTDNDPADADGSNSTIVHKKIIDFTADGDNKSKWENLQQIEPVFYKVLNGVNADGFKMVESKGDFALSQISVPSEVKTVGRVWLADNTNNASEYSGPFSTKQSWSFPLQAFNKDYDSGPENWHTIPFISSDTGGELKLPFANLDGLVGINIKAPNVLIKVKSDGSYVHAPTGFSDGSDVGSLSASQIYDKATTANPLAYDTMDLADANTAWLTHRKYRFKTSMTYDGHQESPLTTNYQELDVQSDINGDGVNHTTGSAHTQLQFDVLIYAGLKDFMNPRITHLNIYVSETDPVNNDEWSEYRLLKEYEAKTIDGTMILYPEDSTSGSRVSYFKITNSFANKKAATYSILNGIPETLPTSYVSYGVSSSVGDLLFVGDVDVPSESKAFGVDDSDWPRTIFVSNRESVLGGAWSQFNWAQDFINLDGKPTGLHGFNNRMFAFTKTDMYRINPATLNVEEKYNNIGCYNKNCVASTSNVMFWMSPDNIYMMRSGQIEPIGLPIQLDETFKKGIKNLLPTPEQYSATISSHVDPFVYYNARKLSFVVVFNNTDRWSYNVPHTRWDRLEDDSSSVAYKMQSVTTGMFNEPLTLGDGSKNVIVRLNEQIKDLSNSKWQWKGHAMNMGTPNQTKVFKKISIKMEVPKTEYSDADYGNWWHNYNYFGDDALGENDSGNTPGSCVDGTEVCLSIDGSNLNYSSTEAIAGFQFNHTGNASTANGGDADDEGFVIIASETSVLGFSYVGEIIPAGSGTLINLGSSLNTQEQLTNFIFSDAAGQPLVSNWQISADTERVPWQSSAWKYSTRERVNASGNWDLAEVDYDLNAWANTGSVSQEIGKMRGAIGIYVDGIRMVPKKYKQYLEITDGDALNNICVTDFYLTNDAKGKAIEVFFGDPNDETDSYTSSLHGPKRTSIGIGDDGESQNDFTSMHGEIKVLSFEVIFRRKAVK